MISDGATLKRFATAALWEIKNQSRVTSCGIMLLKRWRMFAKALGMDLPYRKKKDRDQRVRELIEIGRK